MSLTQRYAVVYDMPVTVDLDRAFAGDSFPFGWNPDYGSRLGLLPREGDTADIRVGRGAARLRVPPNRHAYDVEGG